MGGACTTYRGDKKYLQGNVREKPGRPWSRWEHITLDLKGIEWEVRGWTDLTLNRLSSRLL